MKPILAFLVLLSACAAASAIPVSPANLALQGTASQSSTGYNGPAALAIDGNTSGHHADGSVSHTADGDSAPWWMVALGGDHEIGNVTVHNRTDCCADRLRDFTLELLDDGATVASEFVQGDYGTWGFFEFNGIKADAVRISKGSLYLSLAEVQVFAVDRTTPGTVPEPATLGLLLAAAGVGAALRRRSGIRRRGAVAWAVVG